MQIYNVYQSGKRLYIDEKEIPDNKIVCNKYDNMQQTLRLVSDGTLPPRLYWALRNPKLSNKYFILKLVNNEDLIVGTDISAYPGLWDMLLIGTDEDYIIEGTDIDQSRLTYVSDHFGRLFVRDNFLEELDFEEQCSPTFRIFYDEIMFSLGNKADKKDIPDKLSDLENDTNFISGVALKDDGEGNVKIVGTTFEGSETEEGGGGNYNLPVANETTLGGVKPLNKTEDMTLDVGVDKNGRLFAKGKDITVDSELDKESQNPVQNKVITAEVKALREENEALEQKNAELEEKNAELESSIEKLQIKSTTDKAPYHHITDSTNYRVLDFGMEGITEQETTPGNQLFDISKFKSNSLEINNGDGSITLTSYAPDAVNNKISECLPTVKAGDTIIFSNTVYFGGDQRAPKKSLVITQEMLDNDKFAFYGQNNNPTYTISDIMINKGDTLLPYEPYVGGMPSPNPSYPQEIVNAGKYNEATGRYEHKGKLGNLNFLDISKVDRVDRCVIQDDGSVKCNIGNFYFATLYMTDKYFMDIINRNKGKTMTLSIGEPINGRTITAVFNGKHNIGANSTTEYNSTSGNNYVTFTLSDKFTHYDSVEIRLNRSGTTFTDTSTIIKNLEFKLGEYEGYTPHASQPFTLTSDRPLTKWDKLVKRDGVYGYSIFSVISNGFTFVYQGTDETINGRIRHRYQTNLRTIYVDGSESEQAKCTHLSYCKTNNPSDIEYVVLGSGYIYVYFYEDTGVDTLEKANQWLTNLRTDGENIKFVYKVSEGVEFIPLPDEEQTLLHNLETYYGVTNVYNEQGCPISLSYISDPELHWNQKLEQINNALLSLGANV